METYKIVDSITDKQLDYSQVYALNVPNHIVEDNEGKKFFCFEGQSFDNLTEVYLIPADMEHWNNLVKKNKLKVFDKWFLEKNFEPIYKIGSLKK